MNKITLGIFMVLVGLIPCGCSVNPVTGKNQFMLISAAQDKQIGSQYAPEVEKQLGGRIKNAPLQNYINQVGQRIARISHMPNLEFHYVALDHDSVNAVALPGGYVFITKGLLRLLTSEAQLAGILAHETTHVTARHSAQAMSMQIGIDVLLSAVTSESTPQSTRTVASLASQLTHLNYSREHEYEADQYGMDYAVGAGYDPMGMIETMSILQEQNKVRSIEFFSTHPNPSNRKQMLQLQMINRQYRKTGLRVGVEDYRKFILTNLPDKTEGPG